ncbi:competence protein TfoX [Flavobacteriaceae bacterium Ap0902]|nr:competence protein TfoX [Flavobacteriaceae bacterium Ap0902]
MASTEDFKDYVLDQIPFDGMLSARKMFGEYCIYANHKVLGLITNNQLYIKPTPVGLKLHQGALGKPFPRAKDYILIEDELENPDLLEELINESYKALPFPKSKKNKEVKD